jgi:hypothetical protein
MAPHDVALFAAFVLDDRSSLYTRYEFDITLGPGISGLVAADPTLQAMSDYLNKLKVDVIAWHGGVPTVFEVKPSIGLSAFGQILAYTWYYEQEFGRQAYKGIITDYATPNLATLCEAFGIPVVLVHPASPAQIVQAQRKLSSLI